MTNAIAGAALDAGIRTEFLNTYQSEYEKMEAELKDMARLAVPSDKILEKYVYFESAPHPKRQPRDEDMDYGDYKPASFVVANHRFSRGIKLHEDDVADDQTAGGFVQRAGDLGANFALLPERIFYQILLSTTDLDLLPVVPNAPDGVAMFSATDGSGAARFGATGGNIITGDTVGNAGNIKTNFFEAVARYGLFKDTKGQPLIHPSKLKTFGVWFNIANHEVFYEAFKGQRQIKVFTGGAGENVAAGISNTIDEAGITVKLYPTSRITDNDWFVRCLSIRHQSLFEQSRAPLKEVRGDDSNSDSARNTGYNYRGWKSRSGYGLALPYDWQKVDNS